MNDDLISRADAIQAVRHAWAKGLEPSQYIEIVPAVDAAPVVHGRWMTCEDGWGDLHYQCSECGCEWFLEDGSPADNDMNYCPHCCAKMDGGETDGE